jgi:phosphoribosylaminoimidazole-succinocarboxamide synthase
VLGAKVRDVYESGEHLVLVTTDRQSAFDRVLASIPFKGQVCSSALFRATSVNKHLSDLHEIVTLLRGCQLTTLMSQVIMV